MVPEREFNPQGTKYRGILSSQAVLNNYENSLLYLILQPLTTVIHTVMIRFASF